MTTLSKACEQAQKRFQNKVTEWQRQKRPVIYIDECGFAQDMPRAHGYSHKGTRCFGKKDWGAKGRTNVIEAFLGKTLLCSCLLECNVDSEGISYQGYATTVAPFT